MEDVHVISRRQRNVKKRKAMAITSNVGLIQDQQAQQHTPLESQFLEFKKKHQDTILLIETGYLFRMFSEDAKVAEKELKLKTSAGHSLITTSIPMQSLHFYIRQFVARGYKVGVVRKSETLLMKSTGENPNSICKREVSSIFTKSTLVGEELDSLNSSPDRFKCDANPSSFLMCLNEMPVGSRVKIGIVAVCLLSGEMIYNEFMDTETRCHLQSQLSHLNPAEVIFPKCRISATTLTALEGTSPNGHTITDGEGPRLEGINDDHFNFETAQHALDEFYKNATYLDGSSTDNFMTFVMDFPPLVICCLGALLMFLKDFKLENILVLIQGMRRFSFKHDCLYLSKRTVQLLELFHANQNSKSIFWFLNQTSTSFGSKLLMSWLSQPLKNSSSIEERLNAVSELKDGLGSKPVISSLKSLLANMPDLENGITSVFHKKCGTKKYWSTISSFIYIKNFILSNEDEIERELQDPYLQRLLFNTSDLLMDVELLLENINREAAWHGCKTRLFKSHTMFPALIAILEEVERIKQELNDLLPDIANAVGREVISYSKFSDKDYVIIIDSSSSQWIPQDWIIVARTSRKICCRTVEVERLARKLKLLRDHFKFECHLAWISYLDIFKQFYFTLQKVVKNMATLDCLMAFATVANSENFVRPVILSGGSPVINIHAGSHPVIAYLLGPDRNFVCNDTSLDGSCERCRMITGANMGGKSCYIKSVAVTVILAQIGCFVPASYAEISPMDSILLSSGVRDDLFKRRSTFYLEAEEVSNILKEATPRSLVLLDEFGRSTSDSDGASLACGVVKYLVTKIQCLSLIVTQFQEVTKLERYYPNEITNFHMSVHIGSSDDVTYLYKLEKGISDKGYAVHVYKMVGLEDCIVKRAKRKSEELEENAKKYSLFLPLLRTLFCGSNDL